VSSNPDQQSCPSPRTTECNTERCDLGPGSSATITFEIDDSALDNPDTKVKFETDFKKLMAKLMGVSEERIIIVAVYKGSIVVEFTVAEGKAGEPTSAQVLTDLEAKTAEQLQADVDRVADQNADLSSWSVSAVDVDPAPAQGPAPGPAPAPEPAPGSDRPRPTSGASTPVVSALVCALVAMITILW
jgi:hypothetical protein